MSTRRSCAEVVVMSEKIDVGSYNSGETPHLISVSIPVKVWLNRFLDLVDRILEYYLGMIVGTVAGWLIGLGVGKFYVEYYEPVYMNNLTKFYHWISIPYEFARNGAIIGLVTGVIVITIINNKRLSQRVISLYKNESTDPKDIAQALGKSIGQIERKMSMLAKKRKINPKTTVDTSNHETIIERNTK